MCAAGSRRRELEWPVRQITVNLAPAGAAQGGLGLRPADRAGGARAPRARCRPSASATHAAVGELALDGRVRPVGGVLAVAEAARRAGVERLLCAAESAAEASLAGIEPVPVRHLAEAAAYLRGDAEPPPYEPPERRRTQPAYPDLADVRGQERARRALELAAAGGHNLLLAGPPGTGKTMLARRLPGMLPPLEPEEALEVTRIHSVAGLLAPEHPLIRHPPFRAPHHSASMAALVGGGRLARPGEVSLAHRGVLLLDELPGVPARRRSRRSASRSRTASSASPGRRAGRSIRRVSSCGNDEPLPLRRARRPAAGVLLLAAAARLLPREALARAARSIRPRRHSAAPARRRARGGAGRGVGAGRGAGRRCARRRLAAEPPRRTPEADELLDRAVERLPLSGRGRARVARVARTAAALAGSDAVAARARRRGARATARRASWRRRERARPRCLRRRSGRARPLESTTRAFGRFQRGFDESAYRERLAARGLRWLGRSDPGFPLRCARSSTRRSASFSAATRSRELLEQPAVAIVGARACSSYGAHVARTFGRELAAAGLVVVSGMARGVDGEAHRGALEAGGRTVAVLGCGVDRDYPAAHASSRAGSPTGGLVVSEYAPGVEPAPWRFPARNRIVAGLAQVTVVIEAREKSGALITADLAVEEGREVFAVPGRDHERAVGRDERPDQARRRRRDLGRGRARRVRPRAGAARAARPDAAGRRRCSTGCATARSRPTSSFARSRSTPARRRPR